MDPTQIEYLIDSYKVSLSENEANKEYFTKIKDEYVRLKDKVCKLPKKLSYDEMIPIGPLAFIPGKLVATNTITMHMGENNFAQVSSKTACDIVDHRVNVCYEKLAQLHYEKQQLELVIDTLEERLSSSLDVTEEQVPDGLYRSQTSRIETKNILLDIEEDEEKEELQECEKELKKKLCEKEDTVSRIYVDHSDVKGADVCCFRRGQKEDHVLQTPADLFYHNHPHMKAPPKSILKQTPTSPDVQSTTPNSDTSVLPSRTISPAPQTNNNVSKVSEQIPQTTNVVTKTSKGFTQKICENVDPHETLNKNKEDKPRKQSLFKTQKRK